MAAAMAAAANAVAASTAAFEAFRAKDAAREHALILEANAAQDLLDYDSQDGASSSASHFQLDADDGEEGSATHHQMDADDSDHASDIAAAIDSQLAGLEAELHFDHWLGHRARQEGFLRGVTAYCRSGLRAEVSQTFVLIRTTRASWTFRCGRRH